jgi:hypothetical protein
MGLSRRSALGGLAGLLATLFSWRNGTARPAVADDPIRLIDGWVLRQSDLDALATRDRQRR